MSRTNRRILLVSRPEAEPRAENFKLEVQTLPALSEGQVLVRHHYLSLDPYMRGRMSDAKSYAEPQPLGEVMLGATVGEIVESKSTRFAVGDKVLGMGGWQEYAVVDASQKGVLQKLEARPGLPLSAYLGVVGMPGVTAWYGLVKIIEPKAGETVAVSAASGAVGSVVGQLAKQRGCRVVGIAGGESKCRYVLEELGFDACVDYKKHADPKALAAAVRAAAPAGIDGYFENVGGPVTDAVMLQMNPFGRIAVCGMIAGYNGQPIPMRYPQLVLASRLKLQGFIVTEHMDVWPEALKELSARVASGEIKFKESVAEGIESAPEAFFGLLRGQNFGKQLVKLS